MKSKKTIIRRFKLTAGGKVLRRSAFNRHLKRKKTRAQLRRLGKESAVHGRMKKKIKRFLD